VAFAGVIGAAEAEAVGEADADAGALAGLVPYAAPGIAAVALPHAATRKVVKGNSPASAARRLVRIAASLRIVVRSGRDDTTGQPAPCGV
jgi:hypothetical protein